MTIYYYFFGNKGMPSHSFSDASNDTIENLNEELNVTVFEEDKEVKFPVQNITVTCKNAKETIVWGQNPNREPIEKTV